MKRILSNKKILVIGKKPVGSSGGNHVRKRNYSLLTEYFGTENVDFFLLTHEVFASKSAKEFGMIKVFFKYVYDFSFIIRLLILSLTFYKYSIVYYDQSNLLFSKYFARNKVKIVFFHNIEYSYLDQLYKDKTAYEKKYLRSIFDTEQWLVNNADLCIAINERDSQQMKSLYGKPADFILPVSIKDSFVQSEEGKTDDYMLFVGSDFYGNTDGLFWFIDNCMKDIDMKLLAVGNRMDRYKGRYPSDKIEFAGYIENLSVMYQRAKLVIIPIISGGGMKVKTCEALMYGKIIIGTKEAFEGYSCVDNENCIECNSVEGFIDSINAFAKKTMPIFSSANREYFLEHCETNKIKNKFFEFLDAVIVSKKDD